MLLVTLFLCVQHPGDTLELVLREGFFRCGFVLCSPHLDIVSCLLSGSIACVKYSAPDIVSRLRIKLEHITCERQKSQALRSPKSEGAKNNDYENAYKVKSLPVKQAIDQNQGRGHSCHPQKLLGSEAKRNLIFDVYKLWNVNMHNFGCELQG